MTPIKYLAYQGTAIYTVDYADNRELVCVCPNEAQFQNLLGVLKAFHKLDAVEIHVS